LINRAECKDVNHFTLFFLLTQKRRFRWVVCQLDTLKRCYTVDAIQKQLGALPQTLEETYDRILLSVDEANRHNALKFLQWLAFSARPVTIEEVDEILAIDLDNGLRYDPNLKLIEPRDVLRICSTLVTTTTVSMLDSPEIMSSNEEYRVQKYEEFEAIRLSHMSVKDYLVSSRIRSTKASFYAIDAKLAHRFMAQTCLGYLLNPAFASGRGDWDTLYARLKDWHLFHYSVYFWPYHVKALGESLDEQTWHLIQAFFNTKEAERDGYYGAWLAALTPKTFLQNVPCTQPLYYAASFGLTSVIKRILEADPKVDVNALGGRALSPPLQAASYRNHPDAVKTLLEAGAYPNALSITGLSSLFFAILNEYQEVQKLLEEYGATLTEVEMRELDKAKRVGLWLRSNLADDDYITPATTSAATGPSEDDVDTLVAAETHHSLDTLWDKHFGIHPRNARELLKVFSLLSLGNSMNMDLRGLISNFHRNNIYRTLPPFSSSSRSHLICLI
jgi:hypothetical protein